MSRSVLLLALACLLAPAITANGQLFQRGQRFNSQNNNRNSGQRGQQQPNQQTPQPQVSGPAENPENNPVPTIRASQPNGPRLHWSQTLTDDRQHDFGTVAKAQKQEHVFTFVNNLDSDLHLVNVRTSCGCTKPSILTPVVKPGETARVLAKFDTLNFDGQRGATVSVSLQKQKPYIESAEIQFTVKGMIRRDVVLNPGSVDFGTIVQGGSAESKVVVKYAGNPTWEVTEVRSSNSHINGQVSEKRRDQYARRVDYELQVFVDSNHPNGPINDELTLVTNDSSYQVIKVALTGVVKMPIQASPIQLGTLTTGGVINKSLIVKGERPFEIKEIRHNNQRIKFEQPTGSKALHIIKFDFDTSSAGPVEDDILLLTDDPAQPEVRIPFSATIETPSTYAQNNGGGEK